MNHSSREVALKVMLDASPRTAQHEMAVHAALDPASPGRRYIIKLIEGFLVQGCACLAFERHGVELSRQVRKQGPLSWEDTKEVGRQVLLALDTMHSAGFAHGDIKPGNILWDAESREIRVIDLGWARSQYRLGSAIATRDYCPPEMVLGLQMTTAVDLWMLGCTMFEIFSGEHLFDPYEICKAKYAEFDSNYPVEEDDDSTEEEDEKAPPFTLSEGMLFDNRYRLKSVLGDGKCGEVWLAEVEGDYRPGAEPLKCVERKLRQRKPTEGKTPKPPTKLNIWDVVIEYEHFLAMQAHFGMFPRELAKQGKHHYILFGEDGEIRFHPEIQPVSIADRLVELGRCDRKTALDVEALLRPMLQMEAAKRASTRQMLQMVCR